MKRAWAICKRILLELVLDKRTLAMILIAPIFILFLMKLAFGTNQTTNVKLAAVHDNTTLVSNINKVKHVSIHKYASVKSAKHAMTNQKVDGIIDHKSNNRYNLIHANTDPSKTKVTKQVFSQAIQSISTKKAFTKSQKAQASLIKSQPKMVQQKLAKQMKSKKSTKPTVHNYYNYGNSKANFFNKLAPILINFFVFMFVFLLSGLALLKERTSGTLGRILSTPIRRSEIIGGYVMSYGAIAIVQTLVIMAASVWLMNVSVAGSVVSATVINVLTALVALSIGLLISSLASSEFQMIQFIPIIVAPQILFGGIIPFSAMNKWVRLITYIMPLKYSGDALNGVILHGESITHFGVDIIVLLAFLIVFLVANVMALKKYRKV